MKQLGWGGLGGLAVSGALLHEAVVTIGFSPTSDISSIRH